MVYTAVPTITTGDVATAAWGNTYLKDNFAAGVPDIFTTDGDMAVATGANAAERVAVMNGSNLLKHEVGGIEADISAATTGDTIVGQSSGVLGLETAMTEGQAEAGTDTQVRGVTAERIKQAIAALAGTVASQAEMETASSNTKFVSPGVAKYHPGACKAWVSVDHPTDLEQSYNTASVVNSSTGLYVWNIADDFTATNMPATASPQTDAEAVLAINNNAAGTYAIVGRDNGGSLAHVNWAAHAFGTQA